MSFTAPFRGRNWWVILVSALAAAAVAAAVSVVLPATYRGEATLVVNGPQASRELQLTYAEILTADEYLVEPAAELALDLDELRDSVRAIPAPGTLLIRVSGTADGEDEALRRTNAVAEGFGIYLERSGLAERASVAVVRRAESANRSSATVANAAAGGAAGLLCAVAILSAGARRIERSGSEAPETGVTDGTDEYQ